MKFFLNSNTRAYLRHLEGEFGESSNSIRLELNRFEKAGMLTSEMDGNKKVFRANTQHPLFREVHNIVMKYIGLDQILEYVIKGLGSVRSVYLVGEFSKGLDSNIVDLIIIGDIDKRYLVELIEKAEPMINRKIRYLIYAEEEFVEADLSKYDPEPLLLYNHTR
ncbi:MAG: ArsR family transcriptional regulator [Bacteroidota bacterium]